jgi:hypothetical protein
MSVFASDTFTGTDSTDLTAHTGEVGATWAKVTGVTGVFKLTSNRVKGDSGGRSLYYASGTPASAEYDVEADLYQISGVDEAGLCGRMETGAATYYRVNWVNNQWQLWKVVTGTETSLGTYTDSLSNGNTYHVKLEIRDATKKVFIDSVERISSANNDITAAGKAGITSNNSDWGFGTTGRPWDTFVATDLSGGSATPKGPLSKPFTGPFRGPF